MTKSAGDAEAREAILLVGGYGVVGSQIAAGIRARHPDLTLIVAGRDAGKAAEAAAGIGALRDLGVSVAIT